MASRHIQVVPPPTKDAILDSLLETVHKYNARHEPGINPGFGHASLTAEMPLLLNNRPGAPLPCREPPADFEAVNAHFSAQVHAFFNALHDLEDMAARQPSDELPLIRASGLQPIISIADQLFARDLDLEDSDCLHRAFHTRRLTVQNPENLPILHRVTELRVVPDDAWPAKPIYRRPVSLRTPFDLATRLPQLRRLDCPWLGEHFPIALKSKAMGIVSRVWAGPWRDDRAEFGRAVRYAMPLLPSSLTNVRLWFWQPGHLGDEMDQAVQLPDLVGTSSSDEFKHMDPVSVGLRELGSRLEELDICAIITPDVFPASGGDLTWPHMRHLHVEFHPCGPDGSWYFSGPRGEDPYARGFVITTEEHYPPGQEDDEETHRVLSEEEDEYWRGGAEVLYDHRRPDVFRIRPIAERINPLLLAFASSLRRMPSVEDAELFTWLKWQPSTERAQEYEGSDQVPPTWADGQIVMFRWGVRYEAPAVGGNGEGKVTWQVGEDWKPHDRVIRAFEDIVGKDGGSMEWTTFEFLGEREQDGEDYI